MPRLSPLTLATLAAGSLLATHASAAVLVNDSFSDGSRTDGPDPLDAAFFATNAGTLGVGAGGDAVVPGDNSLNYDAGGNFRGVVANFGPVTLDTEATTGLTLGFDFRLRTLNANTNGLRFGLYNTLGTPFTDDSTAADVDDQGVTARAAIGGTANAFNLGLDQPSGSGPFGRNTDLASGGSGTSLSINDNLARSATFSITRTGTDTLEVTSTLFNGTGGTGGVLGTATGTANVNQTLGDPADFFTFNELGVGLGAATNSFSVDNVTLNTTVVPEPASLALAAAGLGLLAGRRRR